MFLTRLQIPNYSRPGTNLVFKDLDISFEREFNPSIFVIAGAQGCGKTSLLRAIYDHRVQSFLGATTSVEGDGEIMLFLHDPREGIPGWRSPHFYCDTLSLHPSPSSGSLALRKRNALLGFLRQTTDSIILLDNPELGLHPDQQYQLCRELADLKNGNQFIVATHSADFCEALTPAHIKNIG